MPMRHMAAFSRTLLLQQAQRLGAGIAVTGSFQMVAFAWKMNPRRWNARSRSLSP